MTREEILKVVAEILTPFARDEAALKAISEESHILDDLKVNSARLVDAVLAFEDEFDIDVQDEEADGIARVGDAVDVIVKKLGKAP